MPREIEANRWFAWRPVLTADDGGRAWLSWVWRRKEFYGPRTARVGDLDFMRWEYYINEPSPSMWWETDAAKKALALEADAAKKGKKR